VTDTAPYRNNRQCVLKQFKPAQRLDEETLKDMQRRFSVEAEALRILGQCCDQIPKLYDEFSENGEFYLVQEYIAGKTLAEKVENQKRLSENDVRKILANLLPVIQQVHENHRIHRDITPDNIILQDKDGKPILIDFGAVKEVIYTIVDSQGAPLDISVVIGKTSYMPQEQKLGTPKYQSDLYSLGLTSIYLLTGKSPKEITRDSATMAFQWHQHTSGVSDQLKVVIDKATQIDYKDRYSTAKEMLSDLERTVVYSRVTIVKTLTENEAKRKQEEWKRICQEIERREREAKEAVRLYWEQLEREFQEDLERRQAEDAKFKEEVRRNRVEREEAKRKAEQKSYSDYQGSKEPPFETSKVERPRNDVFWIATGSVILTLIVGVVTKLLGFW
jgi:serine/threonine protein kinase